MGGDALQQRQCRGVPLRRDHAGLFVSVDFYEIPADKALATAERLLQTRLAQHNAQAPGQVELFDSGMQPQGAGVEMHCAVQIGRDDVVLHAVYVMPRRVLNLTMATRHKRARAQSLFAEIRSRFTPLAA